MRLHIYIGLDKRGAAMNQTRFVLLLSVCVFFLFLFLVRCSIDCHVVTTVPPA